MYTSQVHQIGSLVEVIKTGVVICVLKYLSDSIHDTKNNVRKTLKSAKFLGEDGKIYGMDEVRVLPDNIYL